MKTIVLIFVYAFQIYLLLGLILAIIVQRKGLNKIDSSVEGAGKWFKIITFPGIVALWPIVLSKWLNVIKKKP